MSRPGNYLTSMKCLETYVEEDNTMDNTGINVNLHCSWLNIMRNPIQCKKRSHVTICYWLV